MCVIDTSIAFFVYVVFGGSAKKMNSKKSLEHV